MISLRSLMDLLPYYFREQDNYKVNGKGLLERYLDIFGTYFDEYIVGDINTLEDVIDVDKTPEVYLGYLWEFLGSMPYANPKAIDPNKWKQYFNGFDDDSTIESLSKLWLYRKDSDGDHYNLTLDQVRALVKYSIALFSIRGTKKFFEILLKLYGFEVTISNGSTYPKITVSDNDDSDYWGSDTDYYGTDQDYAGSVNSLFDIKTEVTKLDSEWLNLDLDTTDNHTNCTRLVNVNFSLRSDYVYNVSSNEFSRLQDRMFNLINMFLPIGTRPHIIWNNVNVGNNYVPKVTRSIEVYIDRTPIGWSPDDSYIIPSLKYIGWYRVYDGTSHHVIPTKSFDWAPLRFMVKIEDTGGTPKFVSDQPKKFIAAFNGTDFSDTEYEDGHIFTINPGNNNIYYPKFKVSVICEEDFDLTDGTLSTFRIENWFKQFNYVTFNRHNTTADLQLREDNDYIPVLIQSASIRVNTSNLSPVYSSPKQVINLTTGELLTLCDGTTKIEDRQGNEVDYSQYDNMCMYVQHLFEPGIYEFAMVDKPEYRFKLEVTVVDEVLTIALDQDEPEPDDVDPDVQDDDTNPDEGDDESPESGDDDDEVQTNFVIDNENPTVSFKLKVTSNLDFLGHENNLIIKEVTNPVARYWNNDEQITLGDPGHYRFYGINPNNRDSVSNYIDINVLSNKYNVNYYLELDDGNKSDDEVYMIRTLIPNRPESGSLVNWNFDFIITLDKSVVEATDILVVDPDAFDLEVLLYRGGNPNRGTLLSSWTANVEVISDDLNNVLPYYKVKGTIQVPWDGSYTIHPIIGEETIFNCPPGLYCVELHDKNHTWPGTSSYRVVDAYVIPQKFDGNLYFDVDIISKAWTSPAGQIYDIDPVTGKYTWGWFKTNGDYLHSVRLVRYNPAVDTPQFRLKLTNNTIGYTRVYMYKLVDNGNEWDIDAAYPPVLSPVIKDTANPNIGKVNPHWLDEAIPKDWGFPGAYDTINDVWDYGKGETGVVGYKGRWLFTGSVYQLGDIITGPQEPGKYLFLINQLELDTKTINYAYLEVREEIQYSLIVDPMLAILQGTAVGTTVNAISSAKFTNEVLKVRITNPDGIALEGYYDLPYAFYAYQAGLYTFELFKFEGGQYISLGLMATFKVLTDNGISDEYLRWEWSDTSDREVQVVTTSNNVDWTVKVQNE